METKKSNRANLENKKGIFLQMGLIVALGIVLVAFEWQSPYQNKTLISNEKWILVPEDRVAITVQNANITAVPMPTSMVLNIVDNTSSITEDVNMDLFDISGNIPEYHPILSTNTEIKAEAEIPEDGYYSSVEIMPEFTGGYIAMQQFIRNNIQYPILAKETGIEGTVYVNFIVEKDGSITRVKLLRSIGGGCDEEAVRVVSMMPNWIPGMQ